MIGSTSELWRGNATSFLFAFGPKHFVVEILYGYSSSMIPGQASEKYTISVLFAHVNATCQQSRLYINFTHVKNII